MSAKDQTLVEKTLAGERNAFGDLVERYSGLVHGLILEATRQPDVVEDLLQEVFCKAFEELASLRQPAKFGVWLARMATNKVNDWLRRQQVRRRAEKTGQVLRLGDHPPTPEEVFEAGELSGALWEALDSLPPEYRRIVVLYHLEGCTLRGVARFLGQSTTTVKWRLLQARKRLKNELMETHYKDALFQAQRERKKRQVRDKVMACLPVVAFFRLKTSRLARWGNRLGLSLVGFGVLGLMGLVGQKEWGLLREEEATGGRVHGWRVRREVVELPAISLLWEPRRPRLGDRVRIEAAGMEPEEGAKRVELHYITDPSYPLDHVVPMRREGEAWVATVNVPEDAVSVFFYVSPRQEGPQDLMPLAYLTQRKLLERYDRFFLVYDEQGKPVEGAEYSRGRMAERLKSPSADILAHMDREITRYPDNFRAYLTRWWTLLEKKTRSEEVLAQVKAEQEALFARYPERPEAIWWASQVGSPWKLELYRRLYRDFPEYERSDEVAYQVSWELYLQGDEPGQLTALEEFITLFPNSRYLDEAYCTLLNILARTDSVRAAELADSLIRRTLVLPYDPEEEKSQRQNMYVTGGALPEGLAYSLRFDQLLKEGKDEEAFALVRRLMDADLSDHGPYLYIGQKLAGEEGGSVLYDDPPTYPRDLSLAVRVLEKGLARAVPEEILKLPGFNQLFPGPAHVQELSRRSNLDRAHSRRQFFLQTLARCYIDQEEYRTAMQYLEEAASLQEKIWRHGMIGSEIYLLLGEVYERLDEWEKAEDAYLQEMGQRYDDSRAGAALERMHRKRYGHLERLHPKLRAVYPQAPDFTLQDVRGGEVRIAAFKGQPVLLFYGDFGEKERLNECLETLEGWGDTFRGEGLAILFISRSKIGDDIGRDFPFPLAMDDDRVGDKYRTRTNTLFLIDREGRLRLRQERWGELKKAGQEQHVQEKIAELLGEDEPSGQEERQRQHPVKKADLGSIRL